MNISTKTRKVIFLIGVAFMVSTFSYAQHGIQFPKDDTASVHKDYPYVLPIWGQKVTDMNIKLQLPFGVNVNYVYNEMSLELTEFSMNFYDGENLDDIINPENLNFTETVATANGVNVRADAWILPFLNVYGLYSRNLGTTKIGFQPQTTEYGLGPNGNLKQITTLKDPIDVDPVTFNSNTFGIGATAVYGWDDYFISADGNMSWSQSDLIEETLGFFVGSARVGRVVSFRNDMKLAFYIGAMYRNFVNKEVSTGSLGVPELDAAMQKAVDGLLVINEEQIALWESLPDVTPGKDDKLKELTDRNDRLNYAKTRIENSDAINYKIKKEILSNWSTQIGANFELSKNWMIRAELGYRDGQKFFMTGLQYRFGI